MLAELPESKANLGDTLVNSWLFLLEANDPMIPVKQEKSSLRDSKSVRHLE